MLTRGLSWRKSKSRGVPMASAISIRPRWNGFLALVTTPRSTRVTDRKSTRLNSSHLVISYAVFCLKKKKKKRLVDLALNLELFEDNNVRRYHVQAADNV